MREKEQPSMYDTAARLISQVDDLLTDVPRPSDDAPACVTQSLKQTVQHLEAAKRSLADAAQVSAPLAARKVTAE